MAIIWSFTDPIDNTLYEVRSAGSSLRLYTNGAFHTQYSPQKLFTGAVWDLLSIPALFSRQVPKSTILMLGVGGGSAIHQLKTLLSPQKITGIELNPIHIKIAKEFFDLKANDIELIQADALRWTKIAKAKFNIIIDDLFLDAPGDPIRPAKVNTLWLNYLERRLRKEGILIQNHLSKKDAKASAKLASAHFESAIMFKTPQYENAVLALYKTKVSARSDRIQAENIIRSVNRSALKSVNFGATQIY